MAKTEVRLTQGMAFAVIAIFVLALVGINAGWFSKEAPAPTVPSTPTGVPLQIVPAIEKTSVYASTYDMADYEGEKQMNRVAGTMDLIKSGNVLETVTTTTTAGAASTAEFNGGDGITGLGDASGYYAHAETVTIDETLKPIGTLIKAAAAPDTAILDDKRDELSAPYTMTLDANDVSKTHYINVERPGDDNWFQFCAIGADYDDDVLEVRVADKTGSYVEGNTNLDEGYDELDGLGVDEIWVYDSPIKNFDELEIPFVVGTAKDVDPSGASLFFYVIDCEENLQNGKIVYTVEDSADADLGVAHQILNITVN